MTQKSASVADVLLHTLKSPSEADRNLEPANVVDGLFAIARAILSLAGSIDNLTDAVCEKK